MRSMALSAIKAGITRLRDKGGASPESLYDLLNGFVTAARSIKARPGTRIDYSLPAGTKGLVLFRGSFVVFSSDPLSTGSEGYKVEILKHPSEDSSATLVDIHFAAPFLGYLYVVAEWSDNSVYHYWLQSADPWQPNRMYIEGDVVSPTEPNGYAYIATRLGEAPPFWAPSVARAIGDMVIPTTGNGNGYEYTVVDVLGSTPASGTTEPTWPPVDGALVTEDTNSLPNTSGSTDTSTVQTPPASVEDRYGTGVQSSNSTSQELS